MCQSAHGPLLPLGSESLLAVETGNLFLVKLRMLRWVSKSNNDPLWGGVDSFNGGKFKGDHDNLQEFNLTWTHRFNPGFLTATEMYYIYQYDSPLGGTCNFGPIKPFVCGVGFGPFFPGFSSEVGAVNYT